MKVTNQKPPIYDEAKKLFNLSDDQAVVFTWGDTIFNPNGAELTPDLIRHEETHCEQQQADPNVAKLWWERYLRDPEWRIEQEAEAYGMQYRFICQNYKDRNAQNRILLKLAGFLSGTMYGSAISKSDAIQKIKLYAHPGGIDKKKAVQ